MATYQTEEAPPIVYENHPVGTGFTGVITECALAKNPIAEYPNKDGSVTKAHKRQAVITNTSGHTKTYEDANGQTVTVPHQVRQVFQFYENPNGSIRKPASGGIFDLWKSVLGVSPKFEPFDDEEIVGRVVMYGVEENIGEGQHAGKTFANISVMMPAQDQTIPEGVKLWTQAERSQVASGGYNAQSPPTAQQVTDSAPQDGTAGMREHVKQGCHKWIAHNLQQGAWAAEEGAKFTIFVNSENDVDRLKEFAQKAESDLKGSFGIMPDVDPMSTGGDALPF